jgi:branched-chain amino acid transport system ATP-binding protein
VAEPLSALPTGRPAEAEPVLAVAGLTRRFGGVTAVDGLTVSVAAGESLGVIGPNGAGKTTLIGLVSGALKPSAGTVHIAGVDVTNLAPPARTKLGAGRTHQIPRPFGRMTVLENLVLAGRHARGPREAVGATRRRCAEILDRTGLSDVAGQAAAGLPLLRRKRLELARALALRPRLLLLDEIGAGLVEHEVAELIALVRQLRSEVDAIVLVEHVLDVITACCERTIVLDFGRLVADGPTRKVLADPDVAAVYLGTASTTGPSEVDGSRPARPPAEPLLSVRGAEVSFGGVRALRGVDLDVGAGEVVALLGANGAGKTTLARAISGVVPLRAGTVTVGGSTCTGLRPDRVTALGVAHCMEGRRIFATLTVEENLLLAGPPSRLSTVYDIFPVLAERRRHSGTAMSGGQQQMLAIGRALMAGPRLVIFDEISLGLAPIAVAALYAALRRIRDGGVAMLVVEQNLERGLALADRAYVLSHGRVALSGPAAEVAADPSLAALYVGETAPEGDLT